jgi:serine/threonine-protein kinase
MMHGAIPGLTVRESAQPDEAGRLDSWKEIANYFRREVRTVQLWEQHEHLPVHRHKHRKVGTVHAYKAELGEWWKRRCGGNSWRESTPIASVRTEPGAAKITQFTLSILPFESPAERSGPAFAKALKERLGASLDGLLPPRLRVACSLTQAQRHALGADVTDADELSHADYLLSGSLEDSRKGLRVEVRLSRGKDRSALWSHTFEFAQIEAFKMHAVLAENVARALCNHVLIVPHLAKRNDIVPAARYAYLRGRYYWSQRSSASSILHALQQFRLATEADPNHAAAFSGMADCYAVLGWLGTIPRETALREAHSAAVKALALDPSLAECHVSMGCILFDYEWDWVGAERAMLRGIDLNPAYAQAYCWYGQLLVSQGRCTEAIEATKIAQDMETASPVVALFLGSAYLHAGQHDSAIQQYQHVLAMQPEHSMALSSLGLAYEQAGHLRLAVEHMEQVAGRSANDAGLQTLLAYVYARAGERTKAEELLRKVTRGRHEFQIPVLDAAAAFTALGEADTAFRYLYAGFEQRSVRLTRLKSDVRLLPLHGDARFAALAQQMRLR